MTADPHSATKTYDAERLAGIVEHMSDAFLALDREWRFTYINNRALASLGTKRSEAIGRNAFELFPQFSGTEWEWHCRKAMEQRVPVSFELHYPPADTWTEVRVYPTEEGIALYYTDITPRKRDEAALKRQVSLVDGINKILRRASVATSASELGLACLEVAEEITASPFGFISELRDDNLLHDIAVSNPGWEACRGIAGGHEGFPRTGPVVGLHGKVVREGRGYFTNAPGEDPDRVGLPPLHPPLLSFMGVPLRSGDRIQGLIGVGNREGGYDEQTLAMLETLAPAISGAFRRMRAETERRRRAMFDRALNKFSRAAHSSLDAGAILDRAVVDVSRTTGLNAVAIHLRDEAVWSFAHTYGVPEELASMRLTDEQAPMSVGVLRGGEPVVMSDTLNDPRANLPLVTRFDIRSLAGVPMTVRGEPFGVFFAGNIGERVEIGEPETDFLLSVSTTLSLALENARLYEGEHRVAETLQQALLALPGSVPGVSFAHAYRSASEAALVGGDFYDIFEMDGDKIGVLIGDVAGKGLEAAALTSLLKNVIRSYSADSSLSPAGVLLLTSELLYRITPTQMFATVFLAFVHCDTRRVEYCNAGHPPPTIIDKYGKERHLPANSPLVGAFEDVAFFEDEDGLGDDELLLLFTDGVTEARRDSVLYGEERVFQIASRTKNGDPSKVVRALTDDVLEFTGGTLSDDVAILAVKMLASGSEPSAKREIAL